MDDDDKDTIRHVTYRGIVGRHNNNNNIVVVVVGLSVTLKKKNKKYGESENVCVIGKKS